MRLLARGAGALLLLMVTLTGCRNPGSSTARGPTKAPGDPVPLFVVHSEEGTAMRALGDPNLPSGDPLEFPGLDSAAAAAAAQPAATGPATTGGAAPAQVALPEGVTQAMVDEGKTLFDGSCFACHGQAGAGGPLAPKLADTEWLHIDGSYDAIVQIILAGVPQPKEHPAPMPPKGAAPLSDEQARAEATYDYTTTH